QPFDYYMFFDVEATCEENNKNYPHEIIEFPVVLVDGKTFDIVDQYRSYVKPYINPTLTEFCTRLTGISQETVDSSPEFIEVLNSFQVWMAKYSLFQEKSAIFVTDGPFDISNFVTKQCNHDGIAIPSYFLQWVDIRIIFARFYKCKRENIAGMLAALHMEFDGRAHSGLDDAKNVFRIARHMRDEGCRFKKTTKYYTSTR
ncbi:exonuclease family protein, partial [Umbelopsis sp. PMI_123]